MYYVFAVQASIVIGLPLWSGSLFAAERSLASIFPSSWTSSHILLTAYEVGMRQGLPD